MPKLYYWTVFFRLVQTIVASEFKILFLQCKKTFLGIRNHFCGSG